MYFNDKIKNGGRSSNKSIVTLENLYGKNIAMGDRQKATDK